MNILPALAGLAHRYPSVLVDAVQEHEPGHRSPFAYRAPYCALMLADLASAA